MNLSYLVRKRNGKIVSFDRNRIVKAVLKAVKSSKEDVDIKKIADGVELFLFQTFFKKGSIPSVEQIQDIIEDKLMTFGYRDTARAYIIYREKRKEAREIGKAFTDGISLIDNYVQRKDWRIHENSNMNYSLQGLNFHISSSVTAKYWLYKIYPEEVRTAHENGDFHIHDLGILSAYCVGWDLERLIEIGFGGVSGKIESKPAKHFRTILGQIVNFIYTLQGEAAGAQAFSNFDTLLAPFVKEDNLSYKQVKQALQEFLFNINVPTRVGFQTPFSNITMDLLVSTLYKDRYVIVGGKELNYTYAEVQPEMDMINKAFAELMMEGDSKGRIFTFPIPTYNIDKDFQWDREEFKMLWQMTGKYGIPYFANFYNSDMRPEDARSMCCRLRLDNRELRKRGGGLFGANPLTGSIGVVTINLPRIAYLSEDEDEFFSRLTHLIEIASTSLEIKRKIVEDFTQRGLYPYSKVYLEEVKRSTGYYWNNHFSTIGIVGMNEACQNLLKKPITDPYAREFALKVLDFMRDKMMDLQEETNHLYNLEATPAEGTAYRLAKKDRDNFPDIITSGTGETPYYTNSVHVPVGSMDDIFDVLSHQDELQTRFTGGTVVHLFLGEKITDPQIVKSLVKSVVEHFHLPYFSITPTFSVCPVHGYIPGEVEFCPYPHTEEELKKYGMRVEIEDIELSGMDERSYKTFDEKKDTNIKKQLFINIK